MSDRAIRCALAAVSLLMILIPTSLHVFAPQPVHIVVPAPTPSPEPYESMVCITPYGKRYHKPDCYTIQDSEDVMYVSVRDAIEKSCTPCKHCKP